MKGGYVHNEVLLKALDAQFRRAGALIKFEASAGSGRQAGNVDMLVDVNGKRIAVEAELSAKRVGNDLRKAEELGVDELWIVVPNHKVSTSAQRRLKDLHISATMPKLCVFTLGQALQQVTNSFSLISRSKVTRKQKKTTRNQIKGKPKEVKKHGD